MNSKLKKIRMKNNYTSKNMADILGISKPFYSQIENGRRRLSYDMAVKIANIFKMKPDELFYEDHKGVK
ncbi:MAG: helix-turn-helix transcriptional regulator [Lactobacillales bacterium]|nr:helix-turn-helix transcriptional regulator [Lactobacillales bacterium]